MKIKSILVKSAAVAALSVAGVTTATAAKTETVSAATVKNDAAVVTVNYVDGNSIRVWNSYKKPKATGQILPSNSSWKVIKTAYDAKGHKWYDLGKKQWVRAKYVNAGYDPANTASSVNINTNTASQTSQVTVAAPAANGSEASARDWIASRESGGSYSASNGQYIGKYQLSASYLNGDYSPANQERIANNYVASRYGSWTAAQAFWQANGWY